MLGKGKKEKHYTCPACGYGFSNLDTDRVCSNCFACTGCEIYYCPSCREEVVVRAKKPIGGQQN
ncbi:MAG: hypothetical protein ACOC0R_06480 [Mariniphaga sp.]